MKNKFMKKSAMLLAATLAMASVTGCGKTDQESSSASVAPSTTQAPESSESQPAGTTPSSDTAENTYPVKEGGSLSYWVELNPNVAANFTNIGETTFGKNLQEQTGITIEFEHPALNQAKEQFNLLLSNRTLPDIIEYTWLEYSGGPGKAIDDGVIIPLNDIIDQYCPNLKAYLEANPEIDKMVKTDDGTYYCFPFIRGADKLLTSTGLMVRQDWLEELNLEIPSTIDEWHEVLTAFKEEKGAAAPFTYNYSVVSLTDNNPFAYAYGAPRGFYLGDDGAVHFGAIEDGYKEYLQTMNQWFEEGLIDPDLATVTGDQVSAKVTNGMAGASFGWCGGNLGTWTSAGQATDEKYVLAPAPYPTVEEGEKPEFGQRDNYYMPFGAAAISTSCENVELAARLLDYAYGEEGHLLYNFGEEGSSYTVVDGEPVYTDEILNNPELSIGHAMGGYIRANANGPFVQDARYIEQYYKLDTQKDALNVWSDTNAKNHTLPPLTPTADESKEQSQIMNEINTYRDEMSLKFMLGNKSFDEWDDYVNTIQEMNIDRVLEIQNAALERYQSR